MTAGPSRPDASMTLLREVTEQPLDPGYAAAAARRRAQREAAARHPAALGDPGAAPDATPSPSRALRLRLRRVGRGLVTLVVAVALGAVLTTAVLALRRPSEPTDRTQLVATIDDRTRQADRDAVIVARLRAQVAALADRDLAGDPDAPSASAGLLVASGTTRVTGPGLVITLDDAPGARASASADPRDVDPDNDQLVQDVDLREVTNGLWAAGAEAIAVNGQRLTSTTAIRSAGGAVLVNFRPLSPPYRVRAIGGSNDLDTRFALTRGATWLQGLTEHYGIAISVRSEDDLSLPALEGQQLQAARVLRPSAASSSATGSTSSTSSTSQPTQEAAP